MICLKPFVTLKATRYVVWFILVSLVHGDIDILNAMTGTI